MNSFSAYSQDGSRLYTWWQDGTLTCQDVEVYGFGLERSESRSAGYSVMFESYDAQKFGDFNNGKPQGEWVKKLITE